MKLTKRGRYWWVDFRLPDGRRRRLSTGEEDRAAAQRKAPEVVHAAMTERPSPSSVLSLGAVLERTFIEHWQPKRSAPVMRRIVDVLKREIGWRPLDEVTYTVLKAYCQGLLDAGKAPATVNRRMSAVGVALREASRRGEFGAVDVPHFAEDNKRERYLSEDEEGRLFGWLHDKATAAERDPDGHPEEWWYVFQLGAFLLHTGFRFSEAFKFVLDGDRAVLLHGETKSGVGRAVPLTAWALQAAQHLTRSPVHDRLRDDPNAHAWVDHRWKQAARATGLADVTLHILRHTCASRLVQRGVDIFTVSKWLGHSSVKVTERYAHHAPEALSQALAALERRPAPVEGCLRGTQVLPERSESSDRGTPGVRKCL